MYMQEVCGIIKICIPQTKCCAYRREILEQMEMYIPFRYMQHFVYNE